MAKRASEPTSGSDRAKVRVLFAEVEGNNESVQEALRTMVSAMGRPLKVVHEGKSGAGGAALSDQSGLPPDDLSSEADDLVDAEETLPTPSERAPRGTGKKTDRNAGLQLVPNLNFRPTGEKPLKDFVSEKDPKNDMELALVAVYYMQHKMNLAKIGPNHLMTAFKEVGKPIPVDLKQTIRNVMNRKMLLHFTDIEDIKTTTQGDNVIEHEMKKSS